MPRNLRMGEVMKLADIHDEEGGDPDSFRFAVEETFVDEDLEVFFSYHPNLEVFLPTLQFGESEFVWDVANELVNRWAPSQILMGATSCA